MVISKEEIQEAYVRIQPFLQPTPIIYSPYFSRKFGTRIYFKLEVLQPTHSFKVRGAFSAILALPEAQRKKGLIAASGGNHGLGVALAAARLDVPAQILLPESTPENKLSAIRALGVEVTVTGTVWDETDQIARKIAMENGQAYIHPFDNPLVMAGQGTMVLELIEQLGHFDYLMASIGGGGLISGILSATEAFIPEVKVIGVETSGADCMAQSLAAGKIVELPAITSIAESLGARRTQMAQFEIVSRYLDQSIVVSDRSAIKAMLEILEHEKLLVEPACACTVAAVEETHRAFKPEDKVVIVLCGGNLSTQKAFQWFSNSKPE